MSSNPSSVGSTAKGILTSLAAVNGEIALGLQLGAVVIPLFKGLVKEIRSIGSGSQTETYEIVLQADEAELATIVNLSVDDLTAINAELMRQGQPTLSIPVVDNSAPQPPAGGPDSPATKL